MEKQMYREVFAGMSETFLSTGNTFAAPDVLVINRRSNGFAVHRSVDIWNIGVDVCASFGSYVNQV